MSIDSGSTTLRTVSPSQRLIVSMRRWLRLGLISRRLVLRMTLVLLAVWALAALGARFGYATFRPPALAPVPETPQTKDLLKEQRGLLAILERKQPKGPYIVVDKMNNRLWVKDKGSILREAKCSAGSGMILRETAGGKRTWVFDTPMGAFKVLSKTKDPVWKKPDWAFVEEGKPIPRDSAERIEYGTLGEYALHFGNGYMIHGTLYERLLGRNVTHGCIRLGRDDLRFVYAAAPPGTSIFVY